MVLYITYLINLLFNMHTMDGATSRLLVIELILKSFLKYNCKIYRRYLNPTVFQSVTSS